VRGIFKTTHNSDNIIRFTSHETHWSPVPNGGSTLD
jgi:hypothetical protein